MDDVGKRAGFTLIEIMIVLSIVAILAAISVQAYRAFQNKAKASEAANYVRTIRILQVGYRAVEDTYLELDKNPEGDVPSAYKDWGDPGGNWDLLGFSPEGKVRYQYSAVAGDTNNILTSFKITAQSDLKGDGEPFDTWEVTDRGDLVHTNRYE
jgi:prepilin-type N-terminal cleavage/methylation domain-containing protein